MAKSDCDFNFKGNAGNAPTIYNQMAKSRHIEARQANLTLHLGAAIVKYHDASTAWRFDGLSVFCRAYWADAASRRARRCRVEFHFSYLKPLS